MNQWIDVHTHLNMLESSPEESLKQAQAAGVEKLITIGTCPEDHPVVLALAQKFKDRVYCTLGIHPHDAKLFDSAAEKYMRENLNDPQVVAVGEIGLDYYYDNSPRQVQQEVFTKQLELAHEFKLPVEVHTRDAEEDTMDILNQFKGKVKGIIHCFTGTKDLADKALDMGFNISISGVVTFNKAEELRQTVKSLPLDRIHVETDAPFLAPVPFRGKKNTPAYVVHVAAKVAEIKGVSLEELCTQTRENALNMFTKIKWN